MPFSAWKQQKKCVGYLETWALKGLGIIFKIAFLLQDTFFTGLPLQQPTPDFSINTHCGLEDPVVKTRLM